MAMSRWLVLLLASALLACVAAETHRVDEKGFRNLLKTIFQKYSYRPKALLVDKKKELADMTINLQDKLGHGILVINLQDSPTMQQIMLKDLPIKELPACFVMYFPPPSSIDPLRQDTGIPCPAALEPVHSMQVQPERHGGRVPPRCEQASGRELRHDPVRPIPPLLSAEMPLLHGHSLSRAWGRYARMANRRSRE